MLSFSRFTPLHSLFASKSSKRIPLCSHFFFSYHHFFFSVSTTFFSFIYFFFISLCSHFFSFVIIYFFSLNFIIQQLFFHYALIMLSRINLFYFQFFHFCLRGDPYRYFIFVTFPTSTSTFSNTYFFTSLFII